MGEQDDKLNEEQIKNWRQVLLSLVGPYALLMPDEGVQRLRDSMQSKLRKESSDESINRSN